ncbi:MAG: ribbon-helix-helix protein, CopG family [bacterium]|nr:ribbon-helix-helix protein, CopG family [bacterium]
MTLDLEGPQNAAVREIADRREVSVAEVIRAAVRAYVKRSS